MLEKIIRKYYDEIFRYCCHHVENRATAEDICQDTFVSFIEHYDRYRSIGKTKNYLYTIARNKCKDHYKKHMPILMEELPERGTGECLEDSAVIKHMVSGLPEELKEVIVLKYFQNLRYADIAAVLQISPSLAKYRVKKGLAQLSAMEGDGYDTKKS